MKRVERQATKIDDFLRWNELDESLSYLFFDLNVVLTLSFPTFRSKPTK